MLMMKDPKKFATLVLSKRGPDYGSMKKENESGKGYSMDSSGADESDDSVGLDMATEAIFQAVESKDKPAFIAAMKDFLAVCESAEPEADSAE
jgi:hypothetical protein